MTEYIYQELPYHEETIMLTKFPSKVKIKSLSNNFEEIIELIKAIRNARAEFNVPDNKRTVLYFITKKSELIESNLKEIAKLSFGTNAEIIKEEPQEKCVKIILGEYKIFIPMGQLVDNEKERERLEKDIASLKFEVERSEKMLSNAGFVAKAPQSMVDKEKEKLEMNRAKLNKLIEELKQL